MESARQLEKLHRAGSSGLSAELKRVEAENKDGKLAEFQAIAPVIQRIGSDPAVSPSSRQYANSILKEDSSGPERHP